MHIPDGLGKVAENLGFIDSATNSIGEEFFVIPDYAFFYVQNEAWQCLLAGLFGVLIMLVIFGIVYLIYKAAVRKCPIVFNVYEELKKEVWNNPEFYDLYDSDDFI